MEGTEKAKFIRLRSLVDGSIHYIKTKVIFALQSFECPNKPDCPMAHHNVVLTAAGAIDVTRSELEAVAREMGIENPQFDSPYSGSGGIKGLKQ